jgi:predicted ATPase
VSDRFLIGLGALTLLAESARTRPLLCVVDDAQWLDLASVEVLAFVARRLLADGMGMFFCVREPPRPGAALEGLTELSLQGLDDRAALALLRRHAGHLDPHVAQQIVTAAGGNPLALIEFGRELTPAQVAGHELIEVPLSLNGRIEARYLDQIQALSPASRTLLLIASAEPSGDAELLWRAAARPGLGGAPAHELCWRPAGTPIRTIRKRSTC